MQTAIVLQYIIALKYPPLVLGTLCMIMKLKTMKSAELIRSKDHSFLLSEVHCNSLYYLYATYSLSFLLS